MAFTEWEVADARGIKAPRSAVTTKAVFASYHVAPFAWVTVIHFVGFDCGIIEAALFEKIDVTR